MKENLECFERCAIHDPQPECYAKDRSWGSPVDWNLASQPTYHRIETWFYKKWLNSKIISWNLWRSDEWEVKPFFFPVMINWHLDGVKLTYLSLDEKRLQKFSILNRIFPDGMETCGYSYIEFIPPSLLFKKKKKRTGHATISCTTLRELAISLFPIHVWCLHWHNDRVHDIHIF